MRSQKLPRDTDSQPLLVTFILGSGAECVVYVIFYCTVETSSQIFTVKYIVYNLILRIDADL